MSPGGRLNIRQKSKHEIPWNLEGRDIVCSNLLECRNKSRQHWQILLRIEHFYNQPSSHKPKSSDEENREKTPILETKAVVIFLCRKVFYA